jgi:hypothetical protein
LNEEAAQLRRVREKEEQSQFHFESLCSEVGGWGWSGSSIREDSLHLHESAARGLQQSCRARSAATEDASNYSEPHSSRLTQAQAVSSESTLPADYVRTSGDDIASIRRGMQAIATKTSSLFALTELTRGDSGLLGSSKEPEPLNSRRQRHLQLLRQGDAMVEQAIRHMEKSQTTNQR